jgi:SET domain-containing protein
MKKKIGKANAWIGFLVVRDIKAGEELVWDYGDRSHDQPWLRNTTATGFSPQKTRRATGAEQPTSESEEPTMQPE